MKTQNSIPNKLELATKIVIAYLASEKNNCKAEEIRHLLQSVFKTIVSLEEGRPKDPAISVAKSIKPDSIVCLECGQEHITLKRHLNSAHNLSPNEYKSRWNLPADYPLVSPRYSKFRSKRAKDLGLGKRPKLRGAKKAAPQKTKRPRGRPKKTA